MKLYFNNIKSKLLISIFFLVSQISAKEISEANETVEAAEVTKVIVGSLSSATDYQNRYFYELLDLCLGKTASNYGPYEIIYSEKLNIQARSITMLMAGEKIDILHTMTSKDRESSLTFIKFDLLKGLLGRRVFVIKEGEESKFRYTSYKKLQKYTAVQGLDWPDFDILKGNGFNVTGSLFPSQMYNMIKKNKADYFPRSIFEVGEEQKIFEKRGLIIEPTLAFQYDAPVYFFFKPGKKKLAKRIEEGLKKARQDGSFDKLFNAFFGPTLDILKNREIFQLNIDWKSETENRDIHE